MIKGRSRSKNSRAKKSEKQKDHQKVSSTRDVSSFLTPCEPTFGLALSSDCVPSPNDAALPKPSLCESNMKDNKGTCDACMPKSLKQSKENLPCNNMNPLFALHSPAEPTCFTVLSSHDPIKKYTKKCIDEKNHLLTEYFPIRRSNRKTLRNVKKETHRTIEDAILSGKEDDFEVTTFPGKGRGIVSKKNIKQGEFVLEYHGELIDSEEAKRREEMYAAKENTGCYMYYFKHEGKQHCIDATNESGRLGRLVNHSKKGNLKTRSFLIKDLPHLILVASRDISPGEELLYDYGDRSKTSLESHPWLAL